MSKDRQECSDDWNDLTKSEINNAEVILRQNYLRVEREFIKKKRTPITKKAKKTQK